MGSNGFFEIWEQLDQFVKDNFELLYEGAVRLGCEIPADYYAPRRIQIGKTRLHERQLIKYLDGHKYDDPSTPSESQLRQTVKDLQTLIDKASEVIPAPFTLKIVEK